MNERAREKRHLTECAAYQEDPEHHVVVGVAHALGDHGQREAGEEAGDQACGCKKGR